MAAATNAQSDAARRGRLLKAAVVIPDLTISGVLWLIAVALLPSEVAVGFLAGLLVISMVVASGAAESVVVRVLHAARRPTPFEAMRLYAPLQLVASRSGVADLRVLVSTLGGPVGGAGRRHVILHREVVDALRAGHLTDTEVAALLAHGVGRLRHGQPRFDLLVTLWTLPWELLRGAVAGAGRCLAWIPLVPFAWQTRFVVGTIAIVLETQAGRWPSPIVIAVFITLSYLMPRARHAWHRHQYGAANRHAAELGLAEPPRTLPATPAPERRARPTPRPPQRHEPTPSTATATRAVGRPEGPRNTRRRSATGWGSSDRGRVPTRREEVVGLLSDPPVRLAAE